MSRNDWSRNDWSRNDRDLSLVDRQLTLDDRDLSLVELLRLDRLRRKDRREMDRRIELDVEVRDEHHLVVVEHVVVDVVVALVLLVLKLAGKLLILFCLDNCSRTVGNPLTGRGRGRSLVVGLPATSEVVGQVPVPRECHCAGVDVDSLPDIDSAEGTLVAMFRPLHVVSELLKTGTTEGVSAGNKVLLTVLRSETERASDGHQIVHVEVSQQTLQIFDSDGSRWTRWTFGSLVRGSGDLGDLGGLGEPVFDDPDVVVVAAVLVDLGDCNDNNEIKIPSIKHYHQHENSLSIALTTPRSSRTTLI